jgi:hypothetical protein
MAGTLKRLAGPAYIAASATNIYTPAAATISTTIRHIHVANKTGAAATFRLYVGATGGSAAGTELVYDVSVAAGGTWDYYCSMLMLSADFLTGLASAGSTLTIVVEAEQNVV